MLRNTVSTTPAKQGFARHLRTRQTPGERVLWKQLRARRFHGVKFRRQVPIGPYIVDFLCVEKKLIIEVDGDSHYLPGAKEKDAKREAYLREKGFSILRFGDYQTVTSTDEVLTAIGRYLGLYEG